MRRILKVFAASHFDPYQLPDEQVIEIWIGFEPDWRRGFKNQIEPIDLSTFDDPPSYYKGG